LIEPSPNLIHLIHPYSHSRPANQTCKAGLQSRVASKDRSRVLLDWLRL
jgi:hypothetical protein